MKRSRDEVREQVLVYLGRILERKDRLVCREIDASGCGTRYDWDRLHQEQALYRTELAEVVEGLVKLVTEEKE